MALTKKEKRQLGALLDRERATSFLKGQGAALRAAIEERTRELFRDDLRSVKAILARVGLAGAATEVGKADWSGRWERGLSGLLLRAAKTATRPKEGALGSSFDPEEDEEAREWFDGYVVELSGGVTQTTKKKVTDTLLEAIEGGLSIQDTADLLDERFSEITPSRAKTIARTELGRVSKGAVYFQNLRSGLALTKTWRSQQDERVRDEHREIDGETVAVSSKFSTGERFPGELSINCRCYSIFRMRG